MYFSMTSATTITLHCTFLWDFMYGLLIKAIIHTPYLLVEMIHDNNFRKHIT